MSKKFKIASEKSHSSRAFQQYHAMIFLVAEIHHKFAFQKSPSNMVKETWRFVLLKLYLLVILSLISLQF
jgi:hypothetical protein